MTEIAVPDGWTKARLGDLGQYINGRGFKKSEWGTVGRPIIRIQNLTGSNDEFNYFDGEVADRHIVRRGDLLISWAATLGAYFWTGPEGLLNQHIFRVESFIDPKFHKYLLDSKIAELYAQTHGSGMVHITRGKFDDIEVLLPPWDEQRRIVQILEDQLSHIEAGERALRSAAKRGELLELAALDVLVPDGTPSVSLKDIALSAGYGTSARCVVDGPGVPVVRIPNVVNGAIDLSAEKRADDPSVDLSGLMLREGDLLFVRTNGSRDLIGRTAVVQSGVEASFASYLIRYQLDSERADASWVHYMMRRPQTRVELERLASSSAGQHNLSLAKLDKIQVPLPDLPTQRELVAAHESSLDGPRRLVASAERAGHRAKRLRLALLVAAFSGKLSGTDSNFERVEEIAGV